MENTNVIVIPDDTLDISVSQTNKHDFLDAINRVSTGERLKDEEINSYFNLLAKRSLINDYLPRVFCFSSFFLLSISKHENSERVAKRQSTLHNLFAFDIILIPIHIVEIEHWTLIEIFHKTTRLRYFDYMRISNGKLECNQFIKFFHST